MTAQTFLLPDLGEGLTEAEIISWAVAVGDEVAVDQVVVTVETAKAQVEVPCPYAGVVAELHGDAGQVLDVGRPLITVATQVGAGDAPGAPDPGGAGSELASALVPGGTPEADRQPRVAEKMAEERAGSGNVLIGYGTSEGTRGRRRRVVPGRAPVSPGQAAHAASQREFAFGAAAPAVPDGGDEGRGPGVSDSAPMPGSRPGQAVRVISPLVRRLAADNGIDLRRVPPSAPGGIITKRDVQAAIARGDAAASTAERPTISAKAQVSDAVGGPTNAPAAANSPAAEPAGGPRRGRLVDERIPLTGIRKVIADKLTQSRHEIPDATTWVDVDATGLRSLRDDLAAVLPEARIGYLALMARIVVAALTRYPELNARVDTATNEIVRIGAVHLSFAAQGPRGLVVPVVHHADAMTTEELAGAVRGLVERAKAGTLAPEEMTGGTFTLNNYGGYGVDGSTPIINHPEAGMLGMGRIIDKPWVVDGQLCVRPLTQLSLTFDHRVCDGGVAGGFLRYVADCVERPGALLAGL